MAKNTKKPKTSIDSIMTQDNTFIKLTGTSEKEILQNAKSAKKNLGKGK